MSTPAGSLQPAWLTAFCFPSTTQKSSNYFFLSKTSICIIYDE